MKLVFQKNANGIELGFVECLSTEEADNFLNWFASKTGNTPVPAVVAENVAEAEVVKDAPVVTVEKEVSKSDVSQAAIALVQSKGRDALAPILTKYNAKRISEIKPDDIAFAFADICQAQGAV